MYYIHGIFLYTHLTRETVATALLQSYVIGQVCASFECVCCVQCLLFSGGCRTLRIILNLYIYILRILCSHIIRVDCSILLTVYSYGFLQFFDFFFFL